MATDGAGQGREVDRERRLGLLVLIAALATIALMLGPLGDLPVADVSGVEVLDDTVER